MNYYKAQDNGIILSSFGSIFNVIRHEKGIDFLNNITIVFDHHEQHC